ncbi:ribonuclease H-like domain-containing protein [Tanacetum coccineum]|uniref:Ribonuclease H-like domain-containing protein n=1 Tax=Tanacetum coccineum TaxID=301880 RepID=A0ABQ4WQL8_9ASTR
MVNCLILFKCDPILSTLCLLFPSSAREDFSLLARFEVMLSNQGIFDSGCSRHMTGNKSFLTNYQEIDGGFVAFGGSPKGGKITGKGKIRTGKLDFEDVYFLKELKFNLFSISQMCDKKNSVLFTKTECLVLSPDFKLLDESQALLKVPKQNNMYSFDLKNVVPLGGLTCSFAKATIDESNLWHMRLGHINFKTMNQLVRGNLDETSGILKTFITGIENQINHKVKIIRCDNGTEFKNNDINQFCGMKGIKREFSVARTPQQNGVAERKNRTLIEAARTMLADSLLPTTFWAEAVSTACYVQNRVLVTKPHNKTPYELLHGRPPSISFMRPFGCPVTILNTLDPLGKFDGKADEGFFVGYSINSKAFRVFNTRTRKVEENLHITFLENKPNVAGSGPDWLFDIDLLTNSMNYEPVTAGNQTNRNAGIKDNVDAVPTQQYILLPLLYDSPQSSKDAVADDAGKKTNEEPANEGERNGQEKEGGASNKEGDQNVQDFRAELDNLLVQQKQGYANSTNRVSTVSPSVSAAGESFTNADDLPTDPLMPDLEDTADLLNTGIFSGAYDDEDEGAEADLNNLETTMNVSPIPTTRIHKDHPKDQIIRDINSATQTRRMTKISEEHAMMDEKSAFLYDTIEEEVYVCQPFGFEDPQFPNKVYKVEKALYGLHQAPRSWYKTFSTYLLENLFRRGIIDKTLFIKKDKGDILLVQVSMIGSLMYLRASRPNIMFVVYACARDLPFDLEAFSDSDYAGASLDRKSTTRGGQFLGKRLISWQCKKQTVVANSTTEAEYVAAANCCGHVLWIQNQMLDYGFNFMNTKIYIDNESTIYEIVYKEWEDRMERATTTASSLEAEQDSSEINRTQSMATLNEPLPQGTSSGCGPRCQVTILGGAKAQTRFEASSKQSNNPPLSRVNILGSGEDSMKLKELMELCLLSENPTIYDSHIKQFWQTATVNTLDNGEQEITTTVDGHVKTIIIVSVRKYLQLADAVVDEAAFTGVDVVHGGAATTVSSIDAG